MKRSLAALVLGALLLIACGGGNASSHKSSRPSAEPATTTAHRWPVASELDFKRQWESDGRTPAQAQCFLKVAERYFSSFEDLDAKRGTPGYFGMVNATATECPG